jgi:hypothetical protein
MPATYSSSKSGATAALKPIIARACRLDQVVEAHPHRRERQPARPFDAATLQVLDDVLVMHLTPVCACGVPAAVPQVCPNRCLHGRAVQRIAADSRRYAVCRRQSARCREGTSNSAGHVSGGPVSACFRMLSYCLAGNSLARRCCRPRRRSSPASGREQVDIREGRWHHCSDATSCILGRRPGDARGRSSRIAVQRLSGCATSISVRSCRARSRRG